MSALAGAGSSMLPRSDQLRRAADVARYYGFRPLPQALASEGLSAAKQDRVRAVAEFGERHTVVNVCLSCTAPSAAEPLMYYHLNMEPRGRDAADIAELNLEVLGTPTSIAEAFVMKAAAAILEECGIATPFFRINSVGDRESHARFVRELGLYWRKHLEELPHAARAFVIKDPLRLLFVDNEEVRALKIHAPRPVTFLSEISRRHFKEVLEYLERMEVAYTIEDFLFGSRDYYTKTVFEVDNEGRREEAVTLARGGRYDELVRRLGLRRDAAGVGVTIYFSRARGGREKGFRKQLLEGSGRERRPKVCFVQVGFEAKLKSLSVLDMLRRARITVYQSIHHDRLSGQLLAAETMRIPYLIILGQREALNNTVIVRNIATRAQSVIPIERLATYLKEL